MTTCSNDRKANLPCKKHILNYCLFKTLNHSETCYIQTDMYKKGHQLKLWPFPLGLDKNNIIYST